jgi:alanyl-tRNA synthetase
MLQAERKVRDVVSKGLQVEVHEVGKKDVQQRFPSLRIKLERIKSDMVRVIEVKGYDVSACSGTHCSNTNEIGTFLVTRFNSAGSGKFEARFMVDALDVLYELAAVSRVAATKLNVETGKLVATLGNLVQNLEKYKKIARNAKPEYNVENFGSVRLVYNETELETKALMKFMQELLQEKTVVCFFNKTEKNNVLLVSVSEDLDVDAKKIYLALVELFGGKGGGGKSFAQGSIETDNSAEVFKKLKEMLK